MRTTETKEDMVKFLGSIVTIEDLQNFKSELLEELKNLLRTPEAQPSKKWLKTEEVKKLLGISTGKLLTLRINGSLPYTRIGGVIYYDSADIQKMFDQHKFQHTR